MARYILNRNHTVYAYILIIEYGIRYTCMAIQESIKKEKPKEISILKESNKKFVVVVPTFDHNSKNKHL